MAIYSTSMDAETIDKKEEERRWSQKKESTIGNNTSAVAEVRATSAAAIWEQRGRKYRRGSAIKSRFACFLN